MGGPLGEAGLFLLEAQSQGEVIPGYFHVLYMKFQIASV
jgi:hypothetical protein